MYCPKCGCECQREARFCPNCGGNLDPTINDTGSTSARPSVDTQSKPAVAPDNYLVWAILATLFCCLPFGIAGIVNAARVDNLYNNGRYEEAQTASDKARKWSMVSAVVAAVCWVLYVLVMVILVAAGLSM